MIEELRSKYNAMLQKKVFDLHHDTDSLLGIVHMRVIYAVHAREIIDSLLLEMQDLLEKKEKPPGPE